LLVQEFLERSAKKYPGKIALISGDENLTFTEVERQTNSLAQALLEGGINKQDRVALFLENSIESVVSIFGILKTGAVFVVLNPQLKAHKLESILNDCQARAMITDKSHFAVLRQTLKTCSTLELIILTDVDPGEIGEYSAKGVSFLAYRSILSKYLDTAPMRRCIDIDLACLIYTSGSTGRSKGVMLTHLNMITAACSITQYLENTSDDVILDVLPLAFDYGLYQVLMAFKIGYTVILEKSFVYPYKIIEILIQNRVTGFPVVPTIAAILLTLKNLDKKDFSHLRYITSTAQAFPPSHILRLRQIFPKTKIYSMYGLTECKRVSYLPPEELDRRPGSVGIAIPNTEVYIVDDDQNVITEAGKVGQLVVRGSHVMKGYWNLPKETARALKPGRFAGETVLFTGDLFKKDSEGYLYFVGRKDDMFKSSGELISPREIENTICECAGVLGTAVIGVDDDILGKAIKAFVVLENESKLTEKDIVKFCGDRLVSFMVPKYVVFRDSLPLTSTGKVQKSALY
jgi:long-chain acyl-CoA synthetase